MNSGRPFANNSCQSCTLHLHILDTYTGSMIFSLLRDRSTSLSPRSSAFLTFFPCPVSTANHGDFVFVLSIFILSSSKFSLISFIKHKKQPFFSLVCFFSFHIHFCFQTNYILQTSARNSVAISRMRPIHPIRTNSIRLN